MRHRKAGRKFKRSPSHRRMLLRNLATALLEHGRIETTLAKAKEVQPFTEKLITLAKDGWNLNNFRRVLAVVTKKRWPTACSTRSARGSRAARADTPGSTSWPRSARATPPRWRVIALLGEDEEVKAPTKPAVVASRYADPNGRPRGVDPRPSRRRARSSHRSTGRRSARRDVAWPPSHQAELHLLQDHPGRDPRGEGPRDRRRRRLPRHPPGESRATSCSSQGSTTPTSTELPEDARRARRRRSCPGSAAPSAPPPAPTGFNVIVNNGRAAGQTIDHGHWHIIPRFHDDPVNWPWPHSEYVGDELGQMRFRIERELKGQGS